MQDKHIFIALGSNLEKPINNINKSIYKIEKHRDIKLICRSPIIDTEPIISRYTNQPLYKNSILLIRTTLHYIDLYKHTKKIECQMGRSSSLYWGAPRTIDIDLLFDTDHGEYTSPEVKIPHQRYHNRLFCLYLLSCFGIESIPKYGNLRALMASCPSTQRRFEHHDYGMYYL